MKTQLMLLASGLVFLAMIGDARGGVIITPAAGFGITWDGNQGDNLGGPVPDNAALASNGGVPVASSPSPHFPTHAIVKLNDGIYGNSNSHINGAVPSPAWSGVILPSDLFITSVAFGRDNLGTFSDRSLGIYTMQFTTNGGTSWTDIGTLDYSASGGFSQGLRHEYEISQGGGPVNGDGIRLLLSSSAIAIDEIEIYGSVIPEPSSLALLALGLIGLLLRRRR